MTALDVAPVADRDQRTPTDLLLNTSLVVAPLLYLVVDVLYLSLIHI